ncbi:MULTISPECIES: hypothetical protein [Pseudanabaena]|uniref:Uncharacterized protein n=2 Tax=Pseudanabaena TaxID=1152 RepID=L8MZL8_9CYAN|nr:MULTISPECIES: hypothetical protein [Pseudanabaena]ELS32941.1 hypothetical protein Pse7429DRAFT_1897 [Pseudanabaena biceps PCC 7429]MDG3494819.1 hypothetical protein [Pseudanabaena catenata USMAC16]
MKSQSILIGAIAAIATLGSSFSAQADSRKAYCQYFPNSSQTAKVSMPCIFSMRQGAITVKWEDGVSDSFKPIPERPFVYTDERGGLVYQQWGEKDMNGIRARILKMENGAIYIWGS